MFREPVFKSIFGKTMRELAPEEYKEIAQALRSCFQDWRSTHLARGVFTSESGFLLQGTFFQTDFPPDRCAALTNWTKIFLSCRVPILGQGLVGSDRRSVKVSSFK